MYFELDQALRGLVNQGIMRGKMQYSLDSSTQIVRKIKLSVFDIEPLEYASFN